MENNDDKKVQNEIIADEPFVNEECGDTMWDTVLKEAEERLRKITNPKSDKDPAEQQLPIK